MSATDVKFSEYSIHTLPQLHYFIEHESRSLTSKNYTDFSWKVIKSVEIDGVKFMLVETKWWAFVSHSFLNRGYRILADRQCTPNSDQLIILFEEESCAIGKQNALQQWEQKIETVLNRHNITGNFKSINRKWGYYQEPTAVITGPKSLEGQPIAASAEFYQTILYGAVRKEGSNQSPKKFYEKSADRKPTLHMGIAQCAIPSKRFLSRVERGTNGDYMKVLPMRINYINEMDTLEFTRYIVKNNVNQCYTSYLTYVHNSMDSLDDSMYTEENRTAIRKTLVNNLFDKYTKCSDTEEAQAIEKERLKLNSGEKTYFDFKMFETKLQTPPENQNRDILLYIHGIDNTVDDALLSASQIACDIGFAGRLAIFSWPSLGNFTKYIKDSMHQIDTAIPEFYKFLSMLCESVRKIHIIAHSKGALLLSRASADTLSKICKDKIGQVILAHGDVAIDYFEQIHDNSTSGLNHVVDRITIYYHPSDKALWFSARFPLICSGADKIGRQVSKKLDNDFKLDNINIGELCTKWFSFNHSVFLKHPLILEDMSEIIHRGIKACERQHVQLQILCDCNQVTAKTKPMLPVTDQPCCPKCRRCSEYVLIDI